jgi:hypothetical protein
MVERPDVIDVTVLALGRHNLGGRIDSATMVQEAMANGGGRLAGNLLEWMSVVEVVVPAQFGRVHCDLFFAGASTGKLGRESMCDGESRRRFFNVLLHSLV